MDMMFLPVLFVPFALILFMQSRREKKRKASIQELRDSLSVGDEITTIGGIVGKIVQVRDDFVTFETGEDRVRIRVAKWAISTKGKATEEQEEKASQQ